MLEFKKLSEQMLLNTVRIVTDQGSGTGFIVAFDINGEIPILITNSHVVNNNSFCDVMLEFHESIENLERNIEVSGNFKWFHHEKYDLCFTYMGPILNEIKNKTDIILQTKWIKEKLFFNEQSLNLLEEVTMVGYPIGLYDKKHNLPLFRKGYTATHPMLNFNGEKIGVVDMACFPGSSGSPIFVLNEGPFMYNGELFAGSRLIFLGILFSGPVYNADGILETRNIDMKLETIPRVGIMTNLGYYIKAEVILDFKEKIIEDCNK